MKLIKHQQDELIDFTIPIANSELSATDKTEVMSMIYKHWIAHNSPYDHFPGKELLSLEWFWLDADKRTLTQRIIYELRKSKAIMTPAFYGKMGNRLRETIPTVSKYAFDFTRKFDWTSGEFGDGRSCFMNGGSRKGVVKEMINNGSFYAMRFYQDTPIVNHNNMVLLANTIPKYVIDDKKYFGRARVWIHYREVTIRKGSRIVQEPVYFMFNSYGKESLREMAAVFAAYVGASFQGVRLQNIGQACGGLYINSGSMIIGNSKVIRGIEDFDFKFKTTFDEEQNRPNPLHGYRHHAITRGASVRWRDRNKVKKFYVKHTQPKKYRNTQRKARTRNDRVLGAFYQLQEHQQNWFWNASWKRGKVFQNIINPSKLRGSWKLLSWRHNANFYSILIKLIQIKMNGGFDEDCSKRKDTGKPQDECAQPTLRRNENHRPGLDQPIIDEIEFDFI